MSQKINLQVVTSTDIVMETTITELYIPAYHGEAGILENHKPYISLLQPGEVNFVDVHNKKHYLYIGEGFIEILGNRVTLISDSVEKGDDLDKEAIKSKLEELDRNFKSTVKSEKDRKPDEVVIPQEDLDEALSQKREYTIKMDILRKMANPSARPH